MKGFRHGFYIPSTLFKVYVAKVINGWSEMGIELNNTWLYTMKFADKQVMLANDKEDAENMTRRLKDEYENQMFMCG